jgi:addiction module RelE/StbE family toxin
MRYGTSRQFEKQFSKLPKEMKAKAVILLGLFAGDPSHPLLSKHALKGEWEGFYSINITSDVRALYKLMSKDYAHFVAIGTHSELYE